MTPIQTEYDTKCETTYLKNCFPVPRKVPDRECRTEYDQVCTQNTQTITKTRTDTQCKDIVKRVCAMWDVGTWGQILISTSSLLLLSGELMTDLWSANQGES